MAENVDVSSVTIASKNGATANSKLEPKKLPWTRNVWKYFEEYAGHTSLHGMKYVGEGQRSKYERSWWAIMFISSMVGCFFMIWSVWMKWERSPVVISLSRTPTLVWDLYFPAVTICPQTKCRSKVFNYTKALEDFISGNISSWDSQTMKNFITMSMVCRFKKYPGKVPELEYDSLSENEVYDTIKNLSKGVQDFEDCSWSDRWQHCGETFKPIFTAEGMCYTFNMLNGNEIMKKERLHQNFPLFESNRVSNPWDRKIDPLRMKNNYWYPINGTGSGYESGLSFYLSSKNENLDYKCRGPLQGYKVFLHNPYEYPDLQNHNFWIPLDKSVTLAVKPNIMSTSEGIINYSPRRRNCYFPSEYKLEFFNYYNPQNCEIECLARLTLHTCKCVGLEMPRPPNITICRNSKELWCLDRIRDEFRKVKTWTEEDVLLPNFLSFHLPRNLVCKCLPACNTITYEAETTIVDLKAFDKNTHEIDIHRSYCEIFFKEDLVLPSIRSELYGMTDFVANCGGLLGLFLGFSLLSLIELIYFISLRLLCNMKRSSANKTNLIHDASQDKPHAIQF